MKSLLGLASVLAMVVGCNGVSLGNGGSDSTSSPDGASDPGGANANDRSSGNAEGELLETGAMAVSPSGAYIVARRNTTTLIVNIGTQQLVELSLTGERFVFSKTREVVYVVLAGREGVVAIDLASTKELWRSIPALVGDASVARVTDDDRTLLVADVSGVFFLDPLDGAVRGRSDHGGTEPKDLELLPGSRGAAALVVGSTHWADGGPHTPVSLVPVDGAAVTTIDVPNCAAPLAVLPDGTRALLSPTYCTVDAEAKAKGWSNPDPVSVIDIGVDAAGARTLKFLKNLPGFGPVALLADGRAVAYLDTKRMDPSMFDDKAQVPDAKTADQYHLMTIEPRTLAFGLHPIGDTLPRFAPSRDGRSLLVDASVSIQRFEGSATATVTLDANGNVTAKVKGSFGDESGSLFGVFGLDTNTYVPFAGPAAALDRFVQSRDGGHVFTLKNNGKGGDLFGVNVGARTSFDLGRSLRDIAILPDGRLVLRIRLESTEDGRLREEFCLSNDGLACHASIEYVGTVPQHDP